MTTLTRGHTRLEPSLRLTEMLHQGPQDFNTLVFRALLPIIMDRVTLGEDRRLHVHYGTSLERGSAELGPAVWGYLMEGLGQFHTAQQYFDRQIAQDPRLGEETHVFGQYAEYHLEICRHFSELVANTENKKKARKKGRVERRVDPPTRQSFQRVVDSERLLASWGRDTSIYLALRHGEVAMPRNDDLTVVFTKARIKNLRRAAEKAARYVCRTILTYNDLVQYEEDIRTEHPLVASPRSRRGNLSSRIVETLAGARAHCLGLSKSERLAYGVGTEDEITLYEGRSSKHNLSGGLYLPNNRLTELDTIERLERILERMNPLDFLFIGSRVKDLFGVTYVTPTIEQATRLVNRIGNGAFDKSATQRIVRGLLGVSLNVSEATSPSEGSRIKTYAAIGYTPMDLVENSFERDDKLRPDGNNRIDLYTMPRPWAADQLSGRYRFELATTSLRHFADDELGGPGSHLLYEQSQYNMVHGRTGWRKRKKKLFALHEALVRALMPVAALQERLQAPEKGDTDSRPPVHSNPTYRR